GRFYKKDRRSSYGGDPYLKYIRNRRKAPGNAAGSYSYRRMYLYCLTDQRAGKDPDVRKNLPCGLRIEKRHSQGNRGKSHACTENNRGRSERGPDPSGTFF